MPVNSSRSVGAAAAVLLTALTGCGASGPAPAKSHTAATGSDPVASQARTVTEQFLAAWSRGDAAAICATTSGADEVGACLTTVRNLKPSGKDLQIADFAVREKPHPIGLASATGTWCIVDRCTTVAPPGKALADPASAQFGKDWNAAQFKSASAGSLIFSLQRISGHWYVLVGG